jgi:hypothetical protein
MAFAVAIQNPVEIDGLSAYQARKGLNERVDFLKQVFDEAGPDFDPKSVKVHEFKDGVDLRDFAKNVNDEIERFRKRAASFDELDAMRAAVERAKEDGDKFAKDARRFAGDGRGGERTLKSLGQAVAEGAVLKALRAKQQAVFDLAEVDLAALGFKTTMTTAAGWAPETTRTGRVAEDEQRPIQVSDIFPVIPTGQSAIVYMEETTFTNNAAERAENAAYAESALALTERSETVRAVGTSLPVTDEQLADEPGVAAYIDQRLGFMVRQRVDGQAILGDGSAPNLRGTLNVAGIQTQAKGSDTVLDAIYKAKTKVRVTGRAMPGYLVIHSNDLQDIALTKTADGIYIFGSPTQNGIPQIWGLQVVENDIVTENTAIVGDYARHSAMHIRKGLEVQTGYVNDDFTKGRLTLRAGVRIAIVHYRPTAFCTATGI